MIIVRCICEFVMAPRAVRVATIYIKYELHMLAYLHTITVYVRMNNIAINS